MGEADRGAAKRKLPQSFLVHQEPQKNQGKADFWRRRWPYNRGQSSPGPRYNAKPGQASRSTAAVPQDRHAAGEQRASAIENAQAARSLMCERTTSAEPLPAAPALEQGSSAKARSASVGTQSGSSYTAGRQARPRKLPFSFTAGRAHASGTAETFRGPSRTLAGQQTLAAPAASEADIQVWISARLHYAALALCMLAFRIACEDY